MSNRTFTMIKPDAVANGHAGKILDHIISAGFHEAFVKRILRLVNINAFKRHQTAPVLRVSPKAFGMGRRMPIVGKYLS